MATTRIIPMRKNAGRSVENCLGNRISYALNPEKTNGGELVSAYECNPSLAASEFLLSKRQYRLLTGRTQKNDVIAYQIRQSFKPGEITPEEANKVGYEFAERFLKGKFPFFVATHVDKAHIHNHIIFNSTALDYQSKFQNFYGSADAVRKLSDIICVEHGLSVIEHPKKGGKTKEKWLNEDAPPSKREVLRLAIDNALAQKPKTFEALLELLKEAGYEIKVGKDISLRRPGDVRFIRLSSVKGNYTKETLTAIIAGTKVYTPRKTKRPAEKDRPSLLIDIDAKLQEGKGSGYARWAGRFNLTQTAKTLSYLTEHKLLDYKELTAATKAAKESFNALSAEIKSAEKRMAEISALRTQIVNYARTREVYVGYRKAGYSKKYLADHEGDILLHKAAKEFFNETGLKKLPTVKELNAEYAELLQKKKTAYADYRKRRDEMRELVIHKANVDRILGIDNSSSPVPPKEQER